MARAKDPHVVSVKEIHAAGGLAKYLAKQGRALVNPGQITPEEYISAYLPDHLPEKSVKKLASKPGLGGKGFGRIPNNRKIGHRAGVMNKLETKYAEHLEARKQAGEIISWRFEEQKFRLADKTWYTPDFFVMANDGSIQWHEVKGFMQDDAAVKLKAVADKFSEYTWYLVRWDSKAKNWKIEVK